MHKKANQLLQQAKKRMEEERLQQIERQKIRKDIYMMEKNLILFDDIDKFENPTYFLRKQKKKDDFIRKKMV
jgi:hypothetical protein